MYSATNMLAKAKDNCFIRNQRNNTDYYREVYLKSDHWKILREEKLASNACCEKCGTISCLDVHHKKYKGLYDVKLNDLQTLCRSCHDKEHKKHKKKNKNREERRRLRLMRRTAKLSGLRECYMKLLSQNNSILQRRLSLRNIERQISFDKRVNWKWKDMNTYVSIHY